MRGLFNLPVGISDNDISAPWNHDPIGHCQICTSHFDASSWDGDICEECCVEYNIE